MNGIFGHGVGSFNLVINEYFIQMFNFSVIDAQQIVASRFLPFTILVELGLMGLLFILYLILESFRQIKQLDGLSQLKKRDFKRWFIAFFIGGMVSASYIFMIGPIFVLVLSYFENQTILKIYHSE